MVRNFKMIGRRIAKPEQSAHQVLELRFSRLNRKIGLSKGDFWLSRVAVLSNQVIRVTGEHDIWTSFEAPLGIAIVLPTSAK